MTRLFALGLALLALAGCATYPPEASGPYRTLNPGRWQATADDLRGVRAALPPARSPALNPPEAHQ